jgi:hypothetical protein
MFSLKNLRVVFCITPRALASRDIRERKGGEVEMELNLPGLPGAIETQM